MAVKFLFSEVLRISDTVVIFPQKNLTKHKNVFRGQILSDLGNRNVAVKFQRECIQSNEEEKILEYLRPHLYVNSIIESGVYEDFLRKRFIVLELCHEQHLGQFLQNSPVYDLELRLKFCTQIVDGMKYVHKKLIIHKDIKPANILLTLDLKCIKIADFGLSQQIKSPNSMIFCENGFGTTGYRPPESFGKNYISLKSDNFSLGVLFYYILSNGESPFGCQSDLWDSNIMNETVNISFLFLPNPHCFAHLIKMMLSKERPRRPTIYQVEKHPFWTMDEQDCRFGEY